MAFTEEERLEAEAKLEEIKDSWHDAIVEMYEIDVSSLTEIANDKYYFSPFILPDDQKVKWKGVIYEPFPVEGNGFELTSRGQIPRPELTVANIFGTLSAPIANYDDLVGAKVTRRRTLAKYLDDQPFADPTAQFPDDIYYIEQKVSETSLAITWQLSSKIDLEGLQIPRRIITQDYCIWQYRGEECGYSGGPIADINDKPLTASSQLEENYLSALNAYNTAVRQMNVKQSEAAYAFSQADISVSSDLQKVESKQFNYNSSSGALHFAFIQGGQTLLKVWNGQSVSLASTLYEAAEGVNVPSGPIFDVQQRDAGGNVLSNSYSLQGSLTFGFRDAANVSYVVVDGVLAAAATSGAGYYLGGQRLVQFEKLAAITKFTSDSGNADAARLEWESKQRAYEASVQAVNSAASTLQAALNALPANTPLTGGDRCGKRLSSCKLRFGEENLPFGGFPGANISY